MRKIESQADQWPSRMAADQAPGWYHRPDVSQAQSQSYWDGTKWGDSPRQAPGWYQHPQFPKSEVYWDGGKWSEPRIKDDPRDPKDLERAKQNHYQDPSIPPPNENAGWYQHPTVHGAEGFWDGYKWTGHLRGSDPEFEKWRDRNQRTLTGPGGMLR